MNRLKKFANNICLVSLLAGLSFANLSSAKTINVPQEHAKIQEAIDIASDGDTILVSPGTYQENLKIYKKSLHLLSTTISDSTRILVSNPEYPTIIIANSDNYTLDGFQIISQNSEQGIGVYSFYSSGQISQNYIILASTGISVVSGRHVDIWNNILEHNDKAVRSNADSTLLSGNKIGPNGLSNGVPAVSLEGRVNIAEFNSFVDNRIGIKVFGDYNELFRNNFIRNTYCVSIAPDAAKTLVMNNLFLNSYNTGLISELEKSDSTKVTVKYNGFHGNPFHSNLNLGKYNFFVTPKFTAEEEHYWPLLMGSFYDRNNPFDAIVGAFDSN